MTDHQARGGGAPARPHAVRLALALLLIAAAALAAVLLSPAPGGGDASAQELESRPSGPRPIPGRYIVTFRDGADAPLYASLLDAAGAAGVEHTYRAALNGFSGYLPSGTLAALQRDPAVLAVERDTVVSIVAETLPTGVNRIDAEPPGPIDGSGPNTDIDVAVIDTGSGPHGDLNVAGGFASYMEGFWVFAVCGFSDSWDDGHWHGTHVAGTIAAEDDDTDVVGVVPGARIWSVRVLGPQGNGCMSDVIAGVDWVTANADTIEVANMSLGGGNSSTLCSSISNSVAAGITYVVAAGNSMTNAANSSPANCSGVVTVSALADFDGEPGGLTNSSIAFSSCTETQDDSLACFSNFGSVVDIAGPGVSILSTYLFGGTASASGTSMASPHVAGAAARYLVDNPGASPAAVRAALIANGECPGGEAVGADERCDTAWPDDPDGINEPLVHVGPSEPPPPTSTPTNTTVPPTATDTPVPTATNTPGPTATPTNTNVPPTATHTPTDTPVPPTPTDTPVPPTPTDTPVPPTPTDTPVPPTATHTPTPTDTPEPAAVDLYLTLQQDGSVNGLSFANEDILAWDDATGFSMVFDGSDVGVANLNLAAFNLMSENEILMSFTIASNIPGVGSVDDSDLVLFTATSLGPDTAGSFSLYFDGSDAGLSSSSEDIDAIEVLPNGDLLISTTGGLSAPGVSAADEDIVRFSPTSLGATTSGTWSFYFDGSDVGLSSSSEDIDGLALDAAGNLFFSVTGNFSVPGLSGADEDVFGFSPASLGSATSGSFLSPLFFDGSAEGLGGNDVYAIDLP